jgi:hypothetical protein
MPVESYMNGVDSKRYAKRLKDRERMDNGYRYPFGLLSVVDLMDRVLKVRKVKTKRRPSRQAQECKEAA